MDLQPAADPYNVVYSDMDRFLEVCLKTNDYFHVYFIIISPLKLKQHRNKIIRVICKHIIT